MDDIIAEEPEFDVANVDIDAAVLVADLKPDEGEDIVSSESDDEENDDEPVAGCSKDMKPLKVKVKNMDMGSKPFKWPKGRPHPLLIPDVLRDVMEHLSMKDVETCRKVSRVWNEEACSILQAKKIIVLNDKEAMKFYLQKMEDTSYFPHSNFELQMENMNGEPLMRTFWNTFGYHIKSLDLRQTVIYIETLFDIISNNLSNLERLTLKILPKKFSRRASHGGMGLPPIPNLMPLFQMPQNLNQNFNPIPVAPLEDYGSFRFPSIKELTIGCCPQDEEITTDVIRDLIRSMPNLEAISLSDNHQSTFNMTTLNAYGVPVVGGKSRIARLILQVLADPAIQLPFLKKIDFPIELGNSELTYLTDKNYQFETLNIKLKPGARSMELKNYLTALSYNLHRLELIFPEGFFSCGLYFPSYYQMKPPESVIHLRELKDLTLHGFAGPLGFLRNLRSLKRLIINKAKFDDFLPCKLLVGMDNDFEHELEELRTDSAMSPTVLVSLFTSFPLLRILEVTQLDDEGLGIIYRNLPYLVDLTVTNGKVTDQGISGVPLEVCVDMAETVTFNFVCPEKFRRDLFLGSLPHLTSLKLSCDEITDISIVFGVVDCKKLKTLTINSSSITDTGLLKIADRFGGSLDFMDIHECCNVSEEGKFYVREKMKGTTLVLEPSSCPIKQKRYDNPNRQVGYPGSGYRRMGASERAFALQNNYTPDEDDDRLPLRDRILMAHDRRRRHLHCRMMHRVVRLDPVQRQHLQRLGHINEREAYLEAMNINYHVNIPPAVHEVEMHFANLEDDDDDDDSNDSDEFMLAQNNEEAELAMAQLQDEDEDDLRFDLNPMHYYALPQLPLMPIPDIDPALHLDPNVEENENDN